jgi:membrane protein DedA with SNARE-associated domain
MTKAIWALVWIVLGLVALGVASPSVVAILHALTPLVLIVGVLAVLIRVVWSRW